MTTATPSDPSVWAAIQHIAARLDEIEKRQDNLSHHLEEAYEWLRDVDPNHPGRLYPNPLPIAPTFPMTTTFVSNVLNKQTGQPWTDDELSMLAEALAYHLETAAREFIGKTAGIYMDPDNTELANKDVDLAWRCIYEALRHEEDLDLVEAAALAWAELNR